MKFNNLTNFRTAVFILVTAFLFSCSSNKFSHEGKIRTDFNYAGSSETDERYSELDKESEEIQSDVIENNEEGNNLVIDNSPNNTVIQENEENVNEVKENQVPVISKTDKKETKKKISRKQKKEIKKALKDFRKNKKDNKNYSDDDTVLYVILAILVPPLAVYLYEDGITDNFWIDLILTLLFWIPGVIYALIIIL